MRKPITSWQDKLYWANHHLGRLQDALAAFHATNPHSFPLKTERDGQKVHITLSVHIEREPPRVLGLIAGDFVGCLRAALDHIVEQMSFDNAERLVEQTCFPICSESRYWDGADSRASKRCVAGLTEDQRAIVHGLQPYKRRGANWINDPLWTLKELSDWDKHRMINIAEWFVASPRGIHLEARQDAVVDWFEVRYARGPVVDGTVLAEGMFTITGPNPRVYVKDTLALHEVFAESPLPCSGERFWETLEMLLGYVQGTVVPLLHPLPPVIVQMGPEEPIDPSDPYWQHQG